MGKHCKREVITTDQAPKAIGPYSVGISAHHFVFASGQAGLDPLTGNLVEGGIEVETRQVMKNLQAVLKAAGADFSQVVKTTVFLTDMQDFSRMNAIYGEYFPQEPPARSTVQVAALPKGAVVEIELIAALPCHHDED